jgi:hypothetical protein
MLQGIAALMVGRNSGVAIPPYRQFKILNSTADNTTFTITFDSAPITGNLLVLIASSGSTLNLPTPATWNKDVTVVDQLETSIYSKISAGTETSITITTNSGAGTIQLLAFEFLTYTTFDKSSSQHVTSGGSTTLAFAATGTTTAANEIAIAVGGLNLGGGSSELGPVVSWSNGFSAFSFGGAINGVGPPYNIELAVALLKTSATGTFSTLLTLTSSTSFGDFNALIATYK